MKQVMPAAAAVSEHLNESAAVFMSCSHPVSIASVTYWVTLLWLQLNLNALS
jgi:hypothetical protein